jgi:hypothetical protein
MNLPYDNKFVEYKKPPAIWRVVDGDRSYFFTWCTAM